MANVYRSKLDIKSMQPNFKPIFVQHDHGKLELELLDGGKPYDLSSATRVEFTHVRKDKLVIIQAGEIVNFNGNYLITYDYQGSEMELVGTVFTSFAVFNENEKKVTSPTFEVMITKDLRNDVFVPAQPAVGFLQTLIEKVENIKTMGGIKGDDGYTPIKGVDYFDGINGKDGKDGESSIAEIEVNSITREKLSNEVNDVIAEIFETEEYSYAVVDAEGHVSEIALDLEGKIPDRTLNSWKSRMNSTLNSSEIVAWGDSLTAWGGSTDSYIAEVGRLSGKTVYNNGVGGETSNTIASRQGGLVMMVNNITIPSNSSQRVAIARHGEYLIDDNGNPVAVLRQGSAGINPCYIKGVKGILSVSQSSVTSEDYVLYFQRETNGDTIIIDRPTPIITDAAIKRRNDIMIIFIGQNGGYADNNELINQIKAMVDFNTATRKDYIVLGLTSGSESHRANLEKAMTQSFGRRYINLRAYLSTYGMEDLDLTPTPDDLTAMSTGNVPPSMLIDSVHHTDVTRKLIGKLVYERMIELGIL